MTSERIPDFDLYRTLEVDPAASPETIEAAYRSLVRRFHPDVREDTIALERTKRLNVAHDWLSDPDQRAAYDRARADLGRAASAEAPAGAPRPAAGGAPPRAPNPPRPGGARPTGATGSGGARPAGATGSAGAGGSAGAPGGTPPAKRAGDLLRLRGYWLWLLLILVGVLLMGLAGLVELTPGQAPASAMHAAPTLAVAVALDPGAVAAGARTIRITPAISADDRRATGMLRA